MPATAAPGLSGMGNAYPPRRRRRYEAAPRIFPGNQAASRCGSATTAFGPSGHPTNPFFPGPPPAPVSALVAHGQVPSGPPSSSSSNSSTLQLSHVHSHLPHQPQFVSTVPSNCPIATTHICASSRHSPPLLPRRSWLTYSPVYTRYLAHSFSFSKYTTNLRPVYCTTTASTTVVGSCSWNHSPAQSSSTTGTGYQGGSDSLGSYPTQPGISAPPVLHSVHPPNVTLASPGTSSQHHYHHHHHHHRFGSSHVPMQPGTEVQSYGRWSSPGRGGSSPPSPDACRARRSEGGLDAERRKQ
ncbi:hypothetical protein FGIG_02535 [Fasciola gigantica]|uniref:Uncharacterized protein n=1 Tax=Fasciola gigantica TaxID=46835 RepID=A0A504YNY1_FASGI|nr:hypothetical protein FGIG_02535 [Fasciola gigantica]